MIGKYNSKDGMCFSACWICSEVTRWNRQEMTSDINVFRKKSLVSDFIEFIFSCSEYFFSFCYFEIESDK